MQPSTGRLVVSAVARPDIRADILAEAWRPGVATPVSVHVRPEVHARMSGHAVPLPLVVDDDLPRAPGFEVHRAVPGPSAVAARARNGR